MRKEMADYDASVPLITRIRGEGDRTLISQSWTEAQAGFALWVRDVRARGRLTLTSRSVQFIILSLVALDGAVLLLKVFLQLIACEMHQNDLRWVVGTRKSLGAVGLTFSVFFLLEAIFSVVSFGFVYFLWLFNVFDLVVILLSFALNVGAHGMVQSIGSLIIVLRLSRLSNISEEMLLGAAERIANLKQRNDELSQEVKLLREELGLTHTTDVSDV